MAVITDAHDFMARIGAASSATEVWMQMHDRGRVVEAWDATLQERLADLSIELHSKSLKPVLPASTLHKMAEHVAQLCDRFLGAVVDEESYPPSEVDEAAARLRRSLFRELDCIRDLTGSLPDDKLLDLWEELQR